MANAVDTFIKLDCEYCGVAYDGEKPKYCCSGSIQSGCGCMGYPINGPFVCSKECYEKLMEEYKAPKQEYEISSSRVK